MSLRERDLVTREMRPNFSRTTHMQRPIRRSRSAARIYVSWAATSVNLRQSVGSGVRAAQRRRKIVSRRVRHSGHAVFDAREKPKRLLQKWISDVQAWTRNRTLYKAPNRGRELER